MAVSLERASRFLFDTQTQIENASRYGISAAEQARLGLHLQDARAHVTEMGEIYSHPDDRNTPKGYWHNLEIEIDDGTLSFGANMLDEPDISRFYNFLDFRTYDGYVRFIHYVNPKDREDSFFSLVKAPSNGNEEFFVEYEPISNMKRPEFGVAWEMLGSYITEVGIVSRNTRIPF